MLEASLSSASAKVYRRPWSLFTTWASQYLGNSEILLPVQPAVLALFISYLYSLKYASSSVTTYVSAIGYVHKLAGVHDPTETSIIIQLLKGYRKLAPVRDVRLPITLPLLRQVIQSLEFTTSSAYQKRLLSALCSLAFFSFLRIGELTTSTGQHDNLIMLSQLDRLIDRQGKVQALQLSLYQYKHSNPGQPFVIYIYPENICCPVQLILDYISLRGYTQGPLFCWPDGRPISRAYFIEQLNAALKFNNLDSSLYKAHSFRIVAASWAAAKGFSDSQIRLLGRWKSNAFLRYIRTPSLSTQSSQL